MSKKKDSRLARAGVEGYNKPKRTPNHPTKSHVVVAKVGDKVKKHDESRIMQGIMHRIQILQSYLQGIGLTRLNGRRNYGN